MTIIFIYRYIAYFVHHLKIYEKGIQLRSSITLIKKYIPYDQILDIKIIKRIPIFYRRRYYPDEFIAITTKTLRRYEIWIGFVLEHKKAIMMINRQIKATKKKRR